MSVLTELIKIMKALRSQDGGCPWVREQTPASIVPYTLEEAYELGEAVDSGATPAIVDELGDLLYHIVFYACMAEESGLFSLETVAASAAEKQRRRHPHVFAGAAAGDAAERSGSWERIKSEVDPQRRAGTLDGVGQALPAMLRAVKLQRRAAGVGFDWTHINPVLDKLEEETGELRAALIADPAGTGPADELGDLLFTCINLCRHSAIDPEAALRRANRKFERRFRHIESRLAENGKTAGQATPDELEALWEDAKRNEDTES